VVERALELVGRIEPERAIRLLGLRAEMPMPEDAREGHTPTRSGW
jgi:DNA polymerase-4